MENLKEEAGQFFETQAYFNRWLRELTEGERKHIIDMLVAFHLEQKDFSNTDKVK